uniref:Choline/carnitine acyltransferase domain-containing protein n=1 Tax=Panagrolaimus sp. JU765 TaxID=591449 RepID=A0AC34QFE0_9BILA
MTLTVAAAPWYDKPLQKPPVPSLEHTLSRYVEYASVLAKTPEQLEQTRGNVKEFLRDGGEKMQQKILEIADMNPNWINLFWLPEMYLKPRYPLPLYSNPAYVFPKQKFNDFDDYLDYSANLIRGILSFKSLIDKRRAERDFVDRAGAMPMCMDQYDRLLTSYREARAGEDVLLRAPINDDEHVMVMCQNQAFTIAVKIRGEFVSANEIRHQLGKIVEMAKNRNGRNVTPMAAATAGKRDQAAIFWAAARIDPLNQESFAQVVNSVFGVCLDIDYCDKVHSHSDEGQFILHGYGSKYSGLNRWFEHTMQLVVAVDGTNGLCIEHSVAEGIVIIKMAEHALRFEREQAKKKQLTEPKMKINPRPLKWRVNAQMKNILNDQIDIFDSLAADLELEVINFTDFGKEKIKSLHISPDGFVQLSMQLAHFRMYGRLVSTYESASIRRFHYGRVDNIRSATPEALNWVRVMDNKEKCPKEKLQLFHQAATKQAYITKENITGYGIDNHLCALSTLSLAAAQRKEIPKQFDMFTDELWFETMRFPLSTSQVTTSADIVGDYLCYGPVVDDGYGNGYNIQKNEILMAVSSRKSCNSTNAAEFGKAVCQAMRDIAHLVETNQ